jgi:protein phosphatase
MSEPKNEGVEKPPSAASLAEAVVAALAQREDGGPAEAAAPASSEGAGASGVAKREEDDAPVISAVSIGGAIAVGAPAKPEDPELTVSASAEADAMAAEAPAATDQAATEPATAASATPAPAPTLETAAAATTTPEGASPASKATDADADASPHDELTAPRGLPLTRDVPEGVSIRYFGRTDVGLVREHNEDNFLVVDVSAGRRGVEAAPIETKLGDRGCVLAVCDGMGGAAAGEVASQMAVDTIHEMMTAGGAPRDRDHFARRLVRAVEEAGSRIFSAAKLDRSRRGMGTTSTVAGLVDSMLFVGQVGDSRAYVLRGDQFALITKDQSLVNQLIEAGQLTEEEAEAFEHSNIILQALGTTEEVSVDLTFLELRRGDRLLLCSDGLSGLVHADMMKDVLRATRDLVDAANQLIALANSGGGHDNITVVVADFDGTDLKEPTPSARVAYQQYPLPPAAPDANDAPPPRPAQVKAATPKPGADVKHATGAPPRADEGGGRWWIIALVVVVVLALLGVFALAIGEEDEVEPEPPTRSTLSRAAPVEPPVPPAPAEPDPGRLRFDGTYAGASLRIDDVVRGELSAGSMLVDVTPGLHRVEVVRDGVVVARGQASVEPGHTEFVRLEASPTAPPAGVEPPAGMAALPAEPTEPDPEPTAEPTEARPRGERAFRRTEGDLPHEPPPRPAPVAETAPSGEPTTP